MKHAVIDIEAVLIEWQPALVCADALDCDGASDVIRQIGFDKVNLACDAGANFATASDEITDTEDAAHPRRFVSLYHRAMPNKIGGAWECLYDPKDRGVAVRAISSRSAETSRESAKVRPELDQVFKTTIVSDQVDMIEPSVAIHQLPCNRVGVSADQCIFVDDGLHNCIGAKAVGLDVIRFAGSATLRATLEAKEVL